MTPRRIAIAALLVLAAVAAFLMTDTFPSKSWQDRKIVVPEGSSLPQVVDLLQEKGILKHPLVFRLLVLGTMTGRQLRFGEYSFPDPPSAVDVWRKLVHGDVTRYSVTVTEGTTMYDIADLLSELELVDKGAFLEAASSKPLLARLGIEGKTVEGFLFPDTYVFVKHLDVEEIIEIMVRQFRRKVTPEMEWQARKAGFTVHQLVTVASIIEKETGVDSEKPLVSAIIRNRIALGMPLQMDPTVIYGLKRFGIPLTRKDLKTPTPYNSYLHRGLPPGPIANPGLSSIRAALAPARTSYLYFVSRNDGSHQFSRSLSEHNEAVAMYRGGGNKEKGAEKPR